MSRYEERTINKLTVTDLIDKTSGNKVGSNYQTDWTFFDDFNYAAGTAPTTLTYAEGTDSATSAEAVVAGASGILRITTGDASGAYAADGVNVTIAQPLNPTTAPVTVEARIRCNTTLGGSINFGLSAVQTLTEPFIITTATITDGLAADAVCFVYDIGATSQTWHATVAPSGTVSTSYDTTTEAGTGVALTADVFQTLKLVCDNAGTRSRFYVDNQLVKTLTHTALGAMYPVIACNSTASTTASITYDVDYIKVIGSRV